MDTMENCTPRHFISYSGVKLPLKLVTPIDSDGMQNRNTFFRGFFDAQDRLVLCQKLVYGEVELHHRYRYYDDGTLQQAEIIDADGELSVLNFDEQGVLLAAD